jgi:hypothetical protein
MLPAVTLTYVLVALAVVAVLAALWALTRTSHVTTKVIEIRNERFQVQDPQTGKTTTYGSLDEVPPDIRAKIEHARASAGPVAPHHTKIVIKDASGTTRTYDSVEQMPADIRAIYERR